MSIWVSMVAHHECGGPFHVPLLTYLSHISHGPWTLDVYGFALPYYIFIYMFTAICTVLPQSAKRFATRFSCTITTCNVYWIEPRLDRCWKLHRMEDQNDDILMGQDLWEYIDGLTMYPADRSGLANKDQMVLQYQWSIYGGEQTGDRSRWAAPRVTVSQILFTWKVKI